MRLLHVRVFTCFIVGSASFSFFDTLMRMSARFERLSKDIFIRLRFSTFFIFHARCLRVLRELLECVLRVHYITTPVVAV